MSGLEVAGVVAGSGMLGWAGNKMLGPVFDEMGQDIKNRYSERRLRNFIRIGRNAEAKAGPALDQPGEVNPRVAMKILEDGSLCDGPIMAEYFGGIMAGSRSPDGSDDRGLAWAALVSRLATMDIHTHYLVYDAFRRLYLGQLMLNWGMDIERRIAQIYVSQNDAFKTMGKTIDGLGLQPSLIALVREGLLGDQYTFGSPQHLLDTHQIDAPDAGMIVTPSVAGMQLYMWAFNRGNWPTQALLMPDIPFVSHEGLEGLKHPQLLIQMRLEHQRLTAEEAERRRVESSQPPDSEKEET